MDDRAVEVLLITPDRALRRKVERLGARGKTSPFSLRCIDGIDDMAGHAAADIVLVDVEPAGVDAVGSLWGTFEKAGDRPVIVLLGPKTSSFSDQLIEAGAHECLTHDDLDEFAFARAIHHARARARRRAHALSAQAALRESQERLQAIHANLPGTVFRRVLHADGRITYPYVSPSRALEKVGLDLTSNFDGVMARTHPDDRRRTVEAIQRSARDLTPYDMTRRVASATGEPRWLRSIAEPRRLSNGDVVWDGIILDVTSQMRAEEALKETQKRLVDIAENFPGVFYRRILHADGQLSYPYVEGRARELYGVDLSGGGAGPTSNPPLIYPGDRDEWLAALKTSAETLAPFDHEMRLVNPSGHVWWVRSMAWPRRLANGDVIWDGVEFDVTARRQTQERLQRSEEFLAAIAANIPGDVFRRILHADGRLSFTYVSSRAREIFGVDADAIRSDAKAFVAVIHPGDRDAWHEAVDRSARSLERFDHEFRTEDGSGGYRWVRSIAQPRRLENGDVVWDGVTIDIDAVKRAEQALQEREARLSTLTANLPGVIFQRIRHADGSVSYPYMSQQARQFYGFDPEQLMADPSIIRQTAVEEDRQSYQDALEASAHSFAPLRWEGRERTRTGEIRWVQVFAQPRPLENGDILWDGLTLDVTDRKLAEQALHESEERLRAITANLAANVYRRVLHADGRVSYPYISWGLLEWLGLDPKGPLADPERFLAASHPDDLPALVAAYERSARTLAPFDLERRMILPSGEVRWLHGVANPRRMANGDIVWDGVTLDITERKLVQEALAEAREAAETANKAKSQFLANISHELRTPLNAILGFSEMMRDGIHGALGSPEYENYSALIHRSGQHLLSIITDLLDMAKIEAGRYELHFEKADLADIVGTSLSIVGPRAAEKHIAITDNLDGPVILDAVDERATRQVILNLLSNAIKFTEPGGSVTIGAERRNDGQIAIRVSDTGIGIPPDALARIFEPFHQVDSSLSRRHEGTGLGLSISRRLMELQGGSLEIDSTVGVGTVVRAYFPLPPS
ncbi:MAG: PAS domain-containing protein [Alphaproteobacteria bacterium]|mgnify:CR=1 FL=1